MQPFWTGWPPPPCHSPRLACTASRRPCVSGWIKLSGRQAWNCGKSGSSTRRDSFFSKGTRPAVFRPSESNVQVADDELHAGRRKLLLAFELPRGCYATILLKQLTLPSRTDVPRSADGEARLTRTLGKPGKLG